MKAIPEALAIAQKWEDDKFIGPGALVARALLAHINSLASPQVTDEQIGSILADLWDDGYSSPSTYNDVDCKTDAEKKSVRDGAISHSLKALRALSAPPAAPPAAETPKTTRMGLVMQLREYANDSGYSYQDYADSMRMAADEIERFENIAIFMAAPQEAETVAADVKIVQRLRAICSRLAVVGIPADDNDLLSVQFSVLGMIQRKIEELGQSQETKWPHEITVGSIEQLISDHQRDGQKHIAGKMDSSGSYLIRVAQSFRWCLDKIAAAPQEQAPAAPICEKCGGKGFIFMGHGEDYECEACFDKFPDEPDAINARRYLQLRKHAGQIGMMLWRYAPWIHETSTENQSRLDLCLDEEFIELQSQPQQVTK